MKIYTKEGDAGETESASHQGEMTCADANADQQERGYAFGEIYAVAGGGHLQVPSRIDSASSLA